MGSSKRVGTWFALFALSILGSASLVLNWYELHPTSSELDAMASRYSKLRSINVQVYKMSLNSGIVVVEEMLETRGVAQAERPRDAVLNSYTVCPKQLKKSVKRGDFVRLQDFGY